MAAISDGMSAAMTMSASMVDDGTKPPVAIVLITSETVSILSVEPKAYSMETNISMYMRKYRYHVLKKLGREVLVYFAMLAIGAVVFIWIKRLWIF